MTPERYERVYKLFVAACDRRAEERGPYLDEACAGDAALRAEVETLLASDAQATAFLDEPVLGERFRVQGPEALSPSAGPRTRPTSESAIPAQIGPYRVLGVLGQGGMGVVYRAEQESPRRMVALKVIRPGAESRETLRRFEHEGQVLGWLQHPGIAQVFEAGTADTGHGPQPFFAMEYIQGQPLSEYAHGRKLGVRKRLELIGRICDAVQHAHQKGVIHRDLKPGNILVDASGQPKILDFGVARVTDADLRTTTLHTTAGQLVGTLAYMSPEQINGDPRQLDTRSDVYSLGVLCYELLTGRIPLDVTEKTIPQAARTIVEEEPAPLGSVNRLLRGDISTIVAKAMEKDKERRYQSAAELAADIRCYLADHPISARPVTTAYQLRKFARRNKPLVAGVLATFLVLVAGIVATTAQTWRATRERSRAQEAERVADHRRMEAETQRAEAERQTAIAKAVNDFLNKDLLSAVDPLRLKGRDVTVLEVLEQAAEEIEGKFDAQPLVEAAIRATLGNTYMSLGKYEPSEPHLERALALREVHLGEDHVDTIQSMLELGYLYLREGRYSEAEALFRRTLEHARRALGADDLHTISAVEVLGVLYKRQGRYADAEPLYTEVLDARRRVLGEEHRETIVAMTNLAILYRVEGQLAKAEPLYTKALELSRRVLGEAHPDTLNVLGGLAVLYRRQHKYDQAEPLYREAAEARRRVLGPEHPDTLLAVHSLATFYAAALHQYEKAEPLFLEVLQARRRVLGNEHPDTLASLHDFGVICAGWGRLKQAEALLTEAVSAQRRVLGDQHPATADSIAALAQVYDCEGRYAEAEPLYREALEKRRRAGGDDDRHTLATWRELVLMLVKTGKLEEAEPLTLSCYEHHKAVHGAEADETQKVVQALVDLYTRRRQSEPAAEWRGRLTATRPSSAPAGGAD